MKLYRIAAQKGVANAQIMLGLAYCTGKGVSRDAVQGYKWLLIAAKSGDKLAAKAVKINSEGMAASQIDKAERLAREEKIIKAE